MTAGLVLFDLDDTLVDRRAAFRAWATAFCRTYRLGGAVDELERLDAGGLTPKPAFFATVARRFALGPPADQLLAAYREGFPAFVPRAGGAVLAGLEGLRARGLRLGVVTNGSAMQLRTIAAAGLDPLFHGCCVSELEGIRKPDAELFRRAAARCGAPLDGAWMVGDSPTADVGAGHALGLRTVWLRHGRAWAEAAYRPSHVVDSLEQALALLAGETDAARAPGAQPAPLSPVVIR